MGERRRIKEITRRDLLRTGAVATGAAVIGGGIATGQSENEDDEEGESGEPGLVSKIEAHGHYAWFPLGPESWARSSEPVDMQEGDSRWLVEPVSDGSGVRCLGENLSTEPPNRNAGFDVHLGRLGSIDEITITSRTLQTPRTTGPALLFLGLYLDQNDDSEFFEWESADGTESFVGLGGDEEGLATFGASGEVTVDSDTAFALVNAETAATTLGELQNGNVEGISAETAAALYVGVTNGGEGTDEVVVEDVTTLRS